MEAFSEDDLKMVMEVAGDVDPLKADLKQVGAQVDDIADAGMARMSKLLGTQRDQLRQINALLGPQAGMVREQVKNELELVDANRRLAELRAQEQLQARGIGSQSAQQQTISRAQQAPTATAPEVAVGQPPPITIPHPPVSVGPSPAISIPSPAIPPPPSQAQSTSARDILAQISALDQQREAINRVNAALDPDVLRQRVQLTHEETQARATLQAATVEQEVDPKRIRERLEAEQKITEARVKYKAVEDQIRADMAGPQAAKPTLQQEEVAKVTAALDQQEDAIKRINALLDPTTLRRRVELARQEKEARDQVAAAEDGARAGRTGDERRAQAVLDLQRQMVREVDQQRDAQAALNAMSDPTTAGLRARLDAQKEITAEAQHQADLASIRDSMEPQALADAVRRQRELTEAREQYNRAMSEEAEDQMDPDAVARSVQALNDGAAEVESAGGGFLEGLQEFAGGLVKKLFGQAPAMPTTDVRGGAAGGPSAGSPRQSPTSDQMPRRSPAGRDLPQVSVPDQRQTMRGGGANPRELSASNGPRATRADIAKPAAAAAGAPAPGGKGGGAPMPAAPDKESAGGLEGIGSTLGAAIGGPAGAAIGGMIGKSLQTTLQAPAKMITGSLKMVDSALSELQGPLGPIGLGLSLASAGMHKMVDVLAKVSPAAAAVVGPLVEVPALVGSILTTLTGFTRLASPATMEQFAIALEDVQAVIGGTFLPVMELLRDGIRLFGDVLANILPNANEMREALSGVRETFESVATVVREVLQEIGPTVRELFVGVVREAGDQIRVLMDVFRELLPSLQELFMGLKDIFDALKPLRDLLLQGFRGGMQQLVRVLQFSISVLNSFIDLLRELGLVGRGVANRGDLRSSVGAAARGAQFEGVEQYQQRLQLAAYSQPGAITTDQVPSLVSSISTTLTSIWDFIRNFTLANLARAIRDGLNPVAPTAQAAAGLGASANNLSNAAGALFGGS